MLGYSSYPEMSVWLAYTSWIPNVLLVLVYASLERRKRRASAATRASEIEKLRGDAMA